VKSDEQLMAAYVGGDSSAFRELYERYAPVLLRVVGRDLKQKSAAEDLVHQTFLNLHRARLDFKADAKVRPWIFTIALNLKRESFRRLGRRPEVLSDEWELPVEGGASRYEAHHTLSFALERLPEDQREVIELHWFGELSFAEIAEVAGTTVAAAKVKAHRGYRRLKDVIEGDTGNPGTKAAIPSRETP
jgi:RNA polymerase sigma factor (sigma-70 family)